MSDANVTRFHRAIQQVVAMPDVTERLLSHALQPQHGEPADLNKAYEASRTTVRGLMKVVDHKPQ
jgi:tripartite-type tricarboxylate transporter receptor subunit TctC